MKRLVLFVALFALSFGAKAQSVNGVILDEAVPVTNFTLSAQDGSPFTSETLKEQWTLLFLGFTHCPDVCPFTLANLEAVRTELSQLVSPEKLPEVVFLAVDPDRDTAVLEDYVKHFGISFTGITGERPEIDKLVESIDGFYRLEKSSADDEAYDVTHSAAVTVINPAGEITAKISPPFHPFNTANYLARHMRGLDVMN
ncbi:MAG: SCO family protein [Roseibium sp.]|uniref:SCO family protein n=1 Tax=Roseibium sp. TaxID=1936156 RepID=UPI001B1A5CA4|nr:SCO family protein [Roseibium sp.]MBO6510371.1 SCO family protein [Roseibium sp.]MBO6893112.1 SCO family protein [Roseibium sp.]MBO6932070.1 SCO family protein [Roseibium sp.]